jgi:hypothetical protein
VTDIRADVHARFEQVVARGLARAAREDAEALARSGAGVSPRAGRGAVLRTAMYAEIEARRRRRAARRSEAP